MIYTQNGTQILPISGAPAFLRKNQESNRDIIINLLKTSV